MIQIEKKDVNSKSKKGDVYPPRIRLNIGLTEQPRIPLSCDIQLSGIKKPNSFTLRAVVSKEIPAEVNTRSRLGLRKKYNQFTVSCLPPLYSEVLQEMEAMKYHKQKMQKLMTLSVTAHITLYCMSSSANTLLNGGTLVQLNCLADMARNVNAS